MKRLFLLTFLAAALAPAAGATVSHREHYSWSEEFSGDPCGIPFDIEITMSGNLVVRDDRSGAPRTKDTYSMTTVFTAENGNWFVQRGHGVVNQVGARHVDGSVYEIVAVDAGQPFLLEDSDGNVVFRDRGRVRHTLLFDMETGEHVETDAETSGPHPAAHDSDAVCAAMAELAGA